MGFYAANFAYDGIISSEYGLRITSMAEDGESLLDGANITMFTQDIYRRPKVFLLGVQQTPVLEIPIEITCSTELSATEDSVVSNWLFGSLNYKKLQILQPDMQYVYYNCIFYNKQTIRYGNIIRGYNGTIICDSPFAWEYPRTISRTYSPNSYVISDDISVINTSDNADYTYPNISFTVAGHISQLSIINTSDVSGSTTRQFLLTNLPANNTVTIDNELQTISASPSGTNLLPYFVHRDNDGNIISEQSYNWLRYVKGQNNIEIAGGITSITLTHQFARKMS